MRVPSFRLRNKHPKGRPPAIRVGDGNRPRSVTLPGIGQIGVHDDTRRLRRMLAKDRAKILFATITHHGGRWWVSLNVEAADLHPPTSTRPAMPADRRRLGRCRPGACRRFWSPPPPTAPKSPVSPMRPKRWPPG